jgi:hypothetical protein
MKDDILLASFRALHGNKKLRGNKVPRRLQACSFQPPIIVPTSRRSADGHKAKGRKDLNWVQPEFNPANCQNLSGAGDDPATFFKKIFLRGGRQVKKPEDSSY